MTYRVWYDTLNMIEHLPFDSRNTRDFTVLYREFCTGNNSKKKTQPHSWILYEIPSSTHISRVNNVKLRSVLCMICLLDIYIHKDAFRSVVRLCKIFTSIIKKSKKLIILIIWIIEICSKAHWKKSQWEKYNQTIK